MIVLEIGTLNVKDGGPPFSVSRQMYGLRENGVESVCLMMPCDEANIIDGDLDYRFTEAGRINCMGFSYVPHMEDSIKRVKDFDIIHIQGIWTYFSHSAAKYARGHGHPYIIAPRGALYKQAFHGKWLKKIIAWHTYQKKDLDEADCIQATCQEELEELRALGCKAPIAIIPNSYDVNLIGKDTYVDNEDFIIGYLGRLNPRKHVEKLIYALADLKKQHANIRLWIIGSEDEEYEVFLKRECKRLKVDDSVTFTGFLRNTILDRSIRKCNIFAFPSDFENWGNVVPDVLVREIPAITSKGMPWQVLETEKCGWWIDSSQESLNNTLLEAYEMGYEELRDMGQRGRRLIEKRFSVVPIGKLLKELYSWIIYGGGKPDFVYVS